MSHSVKQHITCFNVLFFRYYKTFAILARQGCSLQFGEKRSQIRNPLFSGNGVSCGIIGHLEVWELSSPQGMILWITMRKVDFSFRGSSNLQDAYLLDSKNEHCVDVFLRIFPVSVRFPSITYKGKYHF